MGLQGRIYFPKVQFSFSWGKSMSMALGRLGVPPWQNIPAQDFCPTSSFPRCKVKARWGLP